MTDPARPPLDRTLAVPPPSHLLGEQPPSTVAGPPPAHLLQPAGQQRAFGRFVVVKELGRGGMGVVLQAWDPRLSRHVAIKVVDPNLAGHNALARFQREAQAMGRLNHPGIVPVLETGEEQGRPYLVMELVQGESLEALLRREKLPLRRGVEVVRDVAQALAEAHRIGVLHRDIKPGNVLVDETGRPRLTDFGLARVGLASLTKTGDLLGTPTYMPPEQAGESAATHGPPSDVYSLGVLLYRTLTGRTPIEGATVTEYLTKLVKQAPPPMRAHDPTIDPALDAIVARCLEKAPERRYPHAGALADALTAWLAGSPSARARPRLLPLVASFFGGASLAGAAAALALPARPDPELAPAPATEVVATEAPPAPAAPALPALWSAVRGERAQLVAVLGDPGHRHVEGVKAVAVSPDGRWVVSADGHYAGQGPAFLHRWELLEGGLREVAAWRAGSGWITSIAFAPDGQRLITGARDGTLACWDLDGKTVGLRMTGKPVRAVQAVDDRLTFVARDDGLSIVELASRETVTRRSVSGVIMTAALLPGTPRRAIVLLAEGQTVLVPLEGGAEQRLGDAGPRAYTVRVSDDGRWALSTGDGASVREWDLTAGTLVQAHDRLAVSADFLRGEGRAWVGAAANGLLFRRTSTDPEHVAQLVDLRAGERPFCLTSLGRGRIVVGSEMKRVSLVDLDGREHRPQETPGGIWPGALAVHEGRVVVGHDGVPDRASVRVLSLEDGRTVASARTGGIRPVAVLVERDTLVVVDHDSTDRQSVAAFGLGPDGLQPRWRKKPRRPVYLSSAALRPGGTRELLVGDHDGRVHAWSLEGAGEEGDTPLFVSMDVTEDVLAAVALDERSAVFGVVRIHANEDEPWERWSGRLVLRGPDVATEVDLAPGGPCALARVDATRVVVGSMDGRVLQWDPLGGQPRPIEGWAHAGRVWSLAVSPGGRRAASCGHDGKVIVWDLGQRTRLDELDLTSAGDVARAAAFVNETTLVVGTARGVVLKLRLP